MKHKLFSFILVAACAAAALSCNKTAEEDFSLAPDQERDVYLTATMGYTPDTRAVSVSGEAISCTWNEGDQLDLALNGEVITKLTVTSVFGDRAMLSGKVKGAYPQGTQFTLFYGGTSYMYYGQSGTAESAGLRGYLKADVTIAEQDNKTLKLSAVTLEHQQAYFELRFRFGPDLIPVKKLRVVNMPDPNDNTEVAGQIVRSWQLGADPEFNYYGTGDNAFIVAPSGAEDPTTVYFAMRDNTTGTGNVTYKFEVTGTDNRLYTAHPKDMDNGPIQNGRYYSGVWILDQKSNGDGAELVVPTGIAGLIYNGQAQDLITPGMLKDDVSEKAGEGAEMKYFIRKFNYDATPGEAAVAVPAADTAGWSTTVPQETEPGKYYIYYQVVGGDYYKSIAPAAIAEFPVIIDKRTVSVTTPTPISGLKFTGSAQALVNAGTVADKTDPEFFEDGLVMKYYVTDTATPNPALTGEESGWSADIPVGTNAATYYVWYKVDGNEHYHAYSDANQKKVFGSIPVAISQAEAVVANPVPIEGLVYDGSAKQLVLPADASEGCDVYYLVTTSATLIPTADAAASTDPYSTGWVLPTDTEPAKRAPKEKNAGTYYVWTKIVEKAGGSNYTDAPGVSAAAVVSIIAKTDLTITPPTALDGLVYNGSNLNLVNTASGTTHPDGTVTYTDSNNQVKSALEGNDYNATLKYKVTTSDTAPSAADWATGTTTYPAYPQAKNGGTYYIWLKVEGGRNFRDKTYPNSVSVTIGPAPITTTAPTLTAAWTYDGNEHNLISGAATVNYNTTPTSTASATASSEPYPANVFYTYRTDGTTPNANDSDWRTDFLPVTNAANYTVWYKVTGSRNFENLAPTEVSSTLVSPKNPTYTAPVATDPQFDGSPKELVTALTISEPTTGMTIQYKLGSGDWGSAIPSATNAGIYTVYYKATSSNPNYNSIAEASVQSTISSGTPTLATNPTVVDGTLTYNASAQELLSAGATLASQYTDAGCSLRYQVTTTNTAPSIMDGDSIDANWKTDIHDIKGTNAGTYYIWTLIVGGTNYENVVVTPAVTKAIGQQAGSITLDASSMTFLSTEGSSFTHYFNVTTHTGSLSAVSSDTDKADVSISGTIITVTRKTNDAVTLDDHLTITVTSAANTNYTEVSESIPVTMEAAAVAFVLDLSTVETGDTPVVVANGYTITGTLGVNRQISIADGATVTLDNVSINSAGAFTTGDHAGITCVGSATIILKDGTSNTVKGFHENYPGIYVPSGETLIIQGNTGVLTASSNGYGVGIGGGYNIACGNIEIQGGTVTATGGNQAAGIGGGNNANCGNITISGGTVTATGGANGAAGIGSGPGAGCGDITITTGVTKVTATKGSGAPYSIGQGIGSTGCGTITIGGTEYYKNGAPVDETAATYLGQATITYPAP